MVLAVMLISAGVKEGFLIYMPLGLNIYPLAMWLTIWKYEEIGLGKKEGEGRGKWEKEENEEKEKETVWSKILSQL